LRGLPLVELKLHHPDVTNQLMQKMGMVALSAHQIGNAKSAIRPRSMNVAQKIFRCIGFGSAGSQFGKTPLSAAAVSTELTLKLVSGYWQESIRRA
jgi:hypothetical protein